MGYDRVDSFPFDLEPNGFPLGSKSKGKLSPRSYPIQFERKWNASLLSVVGTKMEHFHDICGKYGTRGFWVCE